MRAERAAIAVCWSEFATRQAAAVVRANLLAAALGTCSRMVSAHSGRSGGGCIRSGGGRGVKQAQLQGNAKVATTFTIASSIDRGPLDMLVQIVHAGKTDAVLPEQPWPERTHHVTSENWGHDDHDPAAGQAWILLWDMASILASADTLAAMRPTFPHVVLCHATWLCSAASRGASRRRRAPLLPAPSSMAPSKAWP